MKKALTILLSLLLLFPLVSCTDRQNQEETRGQTPMNSGTPSATQTIDPSEKDTVGNTNPAVGSDDDTPEPQPGEADGGNEMPLDPSDGDIFPTDPAEEGFPNGDSSDGNPFSEHSFSN